MLTTAAACFHFLVLFPALAKDSKYNRDRRGGSFHLPSTARAPSIPPKAKTPKTPAFSSRTSFSAEDMEERSITLLQAFRENLSLEGNAILAQKPSRTSRGAEGSDFTFPNFTMFEKSTDLIL